MMDAKYYPGVVLAMIAAGSFWAEPARADSRVTLCSLDTQPGFGTNLDAAIAAGGTVTFGCSGASANIRITHLHAVTAPLVIDGGNRIILDANGATALMDLGGRHYPVTLRNLTVRGAHGPVLPVAASLLVSPTSSVIGNGWQVTLENVSIERSDNPIESETLTVSNSRFTDNSGVVLRGLTLHVTNATFSNNAGSPIENSRRLARLNGRPIGLVPIPGSLTLTGSTVTGSGHVDWTGPLQVSTSNFNGNGRDTLFGGALSAAGDAHIEQVHFTGNTANAGGAIAFTSGNLSLRRVWFEDNRATDNGGALWVTNSGNAAMLVTLRFGVFRRNSAVNGGAIALEAARSQPRALQAQALLVANNTASQSGGGIWAPGGGAQLLRSVFVANQASSSGGAVFAGSSPAKDLVIANTLLARNRAPRGGGAVLGAGQVINTTVADNDEGLVAEGVRLQSGAGGTVRLKNTLVVNNRGVNCRTDPGAPVWVSSGNNIQYPGTSCGATIATGDPNLDGFYIPLPGSPAIEAGDDSTCSAPPIGSRDLYGRRRPLASHCATGAIEGADVEHQAARILRRRQEISEDLVPVWLALFPDVPPPRGRAPTPHRPAGSPPLHPPRPRAAPDRGSVTGVPPGPP